MCKDFGMIKEENGIIKSINHPNDYTNYESCNIKLYNDRTDCVSNVSHLYMHLFKVVPFYITRLRFP